MKQETRNVAITPYAVLAAVLFNAGAVEKKTVKASDSDEEIEVLDAVVKIEQIGDALACKISLDKLLYYSAVPYSFNLLISEPREGHEQEAIITFEKQVPTATLLAANGHAIVPKSEVVQSLIEKMK